MEFVAEIQPMTEIWSMIKYKVKLDELVQINQNFKIWSVV